MSSDLEPAVTIPEKVPVTVLRHVRSYSIEVTDASAVITRATVDGAMAEMVTRLYSDLMARLALREIREILAIEPDRKMAVRVSFQLIDEGANDWEIRQAAHHELQAFDAFVERERPKLLVKPEKIVRPQ